MDENEQLKLTSLADPIIQMAFGMAIFGDILFILIPIRYILAVFIGFTLWPGLRGFITKLLFILGLVLPLPLMTIGEILGVLLSNSFIRGVVVAVAVGVLTGGVGTLAEAGALALETAGKQAAVKVAGKVGGEKAEQVAGLAMAAKGGGKGGEAESTGVGAKASTGTAARPEPLPSPAAQPPTTTDSSVGGGGASLRERTQQYAREHEQEIAEKLYRDSKDSNDGGGFDAAMGEFDPDVVESSPEDGVVNLKK